MSLELGTPKRCGKIYHVGSTHFNYAAGKFTFRTVCGCLARAGTWCRRSKLPEGARLCKTCRRKLEGLLNEG